MDPMDYQMESDRSPEHPINHENSGQCPYRTTQYDGSQFYNQLSAQGPLLTEQHQLGGTAPHDRNPRLSLPGLQSFYHSTGTNRGPDSFAAGGFFQFPGSSGSVAGDGLNPTALPYPYGQHAGSPHYLGHSDSTRHGAEGVQSHGRTFYPLHQFSSHRNGVPAPNPTALAIEDERRMREMWRNGPPHHAANIDHPRRQYVLPPLERGSEPLDDQAFHQQLSSGHSSASRRVPATQLPDPGARQSVDNHRSGLAIPTANSTALGSRSAFADYDEDSSISGSDDEDDLEQQELDEAEGSRESRRSTGAYRTVIANGLAGTASAHRSRGIREQEEQLRERERAARRAAAISVKMVASAAALASFERVDKTTLKTEDLTCIICYNEFGVMNPDGFIECAVRLPKCKHLFGDHCLKQWLKDSASCPYCRDKLDSEPQKLVPASAVRRAMQVPRPYHDAQSHARHVQIARSMDNQAYLMSVEQNQSSSAMVRAQIELQNTLQPDWRIGPPRLLGTQSPSDRRSSQEGSRRRRGRGGNSRPGIPPLGFSIHGHNQMNDHHHVNTYNASTSHSARTNSDSATRGEVSAENTSQQRSITPYPAADGSPWGNSQTQQASTTSPGRPSSLPAQLSPLGDVLHTHGPSHSPYDFARPQNMVLPNPHPQGERGPNWMFQNQSPALQAFAGGYDHFAPQPLPFQNNGTSGSWGSGHSHPNSSGHSGPQLFRGISDQTDVQRSHL